MGSCYCFLFFSFWLCFAFILLVLFVCDDSKLNPCPKYKNSSHNFSIQHWNLNSITAHNFAKVNLLQACTAIHEFDMICIYIIFYVYISIYDSYLYLTISSDNDNLSIKDSKSVRADHLGNVKRGGVNKYIKESLPVRCLPNPSLKDRENCKH